MFELEFRIKQYAEAEIKIGATCLSSDAMKM